MNVSFVTMCLPPIHLRMDLRVSFDDLNENLKNFDFGNFRVDIDFFRVSPVQKIVKLFDTLTVKEE